MFKWIGCAVFALAAVLSASSAQATTCPAYTYMLTNGATADADQVMSNFNGILYCANTFLAPLASPTFTGNVGIGTASPSDQLQVSASGSGTLGARVTISNSAAFASGNSSELGFKSGSDFTSGYYTGAIAVQQTDAFNYHPAMIFRLYNGGTAAGAEMMRITSTGYVGIGTTTPSRTLSVLGSIGVGPSATGAGVAMYGTGSFGQIVGINNANSAFNGLQILTGASPQGITLDTSGNVGIGTTAPSYALDVIGDIRTSGCLRYSGGGPLGTCTSDIRVKRNVTPFNLGLDAVVGLQPVHFYYNGLGDDPNDGVEQLGLIAQSVESVAPELVGTRMVKLRPSDARPIPVKTVNYGALTYMLINSVKELKAANDNLKASNDRLAAQISKLRGQVVELQWRDGLRTASFERRASR